ncbi:hypothetical protein M9Y10_041636 [Tritrichomonas musculus]|uniref:DUF1893 domain-containing protein n=1 Tax=Tritrichomonas musculus TaxID=1915356 RepID=A0ABR2K5X2_9EUKA
MQADLEKAKSLLIDDRTCVLVRGDETLISKDSGIKPMVGYIDSGKDLTNFSAADKIVGKAAAMLFVLAKIKAVYAQVISDAGFHFLQQNGVHVEYETKTEKIINRAKTGICPMEEATLNCSDPKEALALIKNKMEYLRSLHKKS